MSAREAVEDALVDLFDAPPSAIRVAARDLLALPEIAGVVGALRFYACECGPNFCETGNAEDLTCGSKARQALTAYDGGAK